MSAISFFGLLVAILVGISLVYNELDRKTIYTIVSKPLHRHQFLLGKFFGLLLTIYVIVAVMTLFFFVVLNYQAQTTDRALEQGFWVLLARQKYPAVGARKPRPKHNRHRRYQKPINTNPNQIPPTDAPGASPQR